MLEQLVERLPGESNPSAEGFHLTSPEAVQRQVSFPSLSQLRVPAKTPNQTETEQKTF